MDEVVVDDQKFAGLFKKFDLCGFGNANMERA